MTKRSPKTEAREYAFKCLYSLFLDKNTTRKEALTAGNLAEFLVEFDQTYFEPDQEHPHSLMEPAVKKFAIHLIEGTLADEGVLKEQLDQVLHNWKTHQLDKVDLTVLMMGLFELKTGETPAKVVINEAVNLSKAYGGNDSSGFINGILDKLAKLHEEKSI